MVQPLLKWVGNKRRVAQQIISYFPDSFNNYYEPFVGSGAVLIELISSCQYNSLIPRFKNAFASDKDKYLIDIFNYVRDKPLLISDYYKKNIENFNENKKDNYMKIRNRFNEKPNGLDLCLLSRTCFGGIIRFRKSDGAMSTPVGAHNPIKPSSFKKRVLIWNKYLKNVEFKNLDFNDSIKRAGSGDVVYCDPPYTHSQGILYGAQDFNIDELWSSIFEAKQRGAKILVSMNGSRESSDKLISEIPPKGLFSKIVDIDVGTSMVDRFQKKGKTMNHNKVVDKLFIT